MFSQAASPRASLEGRPAGEWILFSQVWVWLGHSDRRAPRRKDLHNLNIRSAVGAAQLEPPSSRN